MKSDLEHLPLRQQQELQRIRTVLLDEFEAAIKQGAGGTAEWRKGGQVLKMILFGSYARDDWVDEPDNGYLSDFDLLVVVSHEKLADIADYWWVAEDKIQRDPAIGRTVNIIVHTLKEVNHAIERGEYFWTDILRDGVMLYELPGHRLAAPRIMTPAEAVERATNYFDAKRADIDVWLDNAANLSTKKMTSARRKNAAFQVHQAVEASYICLLLVHTFYFPRSHNIKFLRSLAEDVDKALIAAWPREQRADRRRFEQLKRAYVEARYSDAYDVTAEDLEHLMRQATDLGRLVVASCQARIAGLRTDHHGQ